LTNSQQLTKVRGCGRLPVQEAGKGALDFYMPIISASDFLFGNCADFFFFTVIIFWLSCQLGASVLAYFEPSALQQAQWKRLRSLAGE
jgi:hypothetical protein